MNGANPMDPYKLPADFVANVLAQLEGAGSNPVGQTGSGVRREITVQDLDRALRNISQGRSALSVSDRDFRVVETRGHQSDPEASTSNQDRLSSTSSSLSAAMKRKIDPTKEKSEDSLSDVIQSGQEVIASTVILPEKKAKQAKGLAASSTSSRYFDSFGMYPDLLKGLYSMYASKAGTSSVVSPLLALQPLHLDKTKPQNKNHLLCHILRESKDHLGVSGSNINQAWKYVEDNNEFSLPGGKSVKSGQTISINYNTGVKVGELANKGAEFIREAARKAVESAEYQTKENPEVYFTFQLGGYNRRKGLEQRTMSLHVVKDTVYASFPSLDKEAINKGGIAAVIALATAEASGYSPDFPMYKIPMSRLKEDLEKIIRVASLEFNTLDGGSRVDPHARFEIQRLAVLPMVQYTESQATA